MRFLAPSLALVLLPLTVGAQQPSQERVVRPALERGAFAPGDARYQAAIDSGRAAVQRLMVTEGIPGMSVAVLVDGQVVWSEGFGFADLENRVPATALTRFRIGSISKPVAAAAVGLLVEQGRLDLDAPIQRYVPSFPQQRWPVSTRQVAGHVAGIRHYDRPEEMLSAVRYGSVGEALAIFANDTIRFEPGTRYSYSSYGWNLVSAAVEGAAGEPFLPFMQRRVFEPLGLRSMVAEHSDSLLDWRARFYERGMDGRIRNAPYVDLSNKWAGGGFVSNAEDVVRFAHAHDAGALLQPATVQLLWTPQTLRNGESTGYGIGWSSGRDSLGRWVGHTGSSTGGRAVMLLYPDHDIAVAALANLSQAPMSNELAARLAAPFLAARGR